MDWGRIAIIVFLVLATFASYYTYKKASRIKTQSDLDKWRQEHQQVLREIETMEASKPRRPWADDPIANSIEWTEASEGGANFRTHELHHVSSFRVEFQPRHPRSWHIAILLMSVGAAIFLYFQTGRFTESVLALLAGMGLNVFGWLIFYPFLKPVVFDKRLGMFWEGRKQPDRIPGKGSSKCLGRIADIYALQLIHTYVLKGSSGDSDMYSSYELNLVMKDGTRLNAIKHGDTVNLHRDAEVLSRFLVKPLWNAC